MAASLLPQVAHVIISKAYLLGELQDPPVKWGSHNGKPTRSWLRSFMPRHQKSLRSVKRRSPNPPSVSKVDQFFDEFHLIVKTHGITRECIYNMDERYTTPHRWHSRTELLVRMCFSAVGPVLTTVGKWWLTRIWRDRPQHSCTKTTAII